MTPPPPPRFFVLYTVDSQTRWVGPYASAQEAELHAKDIAGYEYVSDVRIEVERAVEVEA